MDVYKFIYMSIYLYTYIYLHVYLYLYIYTYVLMYIGLVSKEPASAKLLQQVEQLKRELFLRDSVCGAEAWLPELTKVYMYVYTDINIYVYIYLYTNVYVCLYINMCVYLRMNK
jgi:hypothetical protein